ncbi:unnamed protein product [Amoebophrya sp. A25]|nr:unnamed protein product [Amoebophrya sp. A25]|eukprot:GSA25T00001493001.1
MWLQVELAAATCRKYSTTHSCRPMHEQTIMQTPPGEAICDNKTGLPKPGFEPQFRDCILGAHDAYSRKFAGVPHLDSDRCEPTVPLLLHCEGDAWSLGEQEEQDKREKLMSSRFEKFEHEHPHTKVRFFGPGEVGGSWYDPRRDDQARGVSRRLHEELSHLAVASVPDQELRRILLSADEGTGTSPVLAQGSPFSPQQVADAMHLGHKLNPHNKPVFGPDGIFKNPGDAKKRAEELKDNLAHHAADGAHHGWEAARDIFHHPKDAGHKMHDLHHSLDHTAKAHEKHAPTPWKHWLEDQMDHQKRKHAKDAKGVEHVIEDNKVDLGDVLSGIVDRVDPDHKLLSSADQLQLPEQWRRVRIPEQMPDKVPHLGEKWDWEEGKDAVAHSAGNLFSGDEARSKAEAERLWKGGRKQWDDARRHVLRKDRHHHHPPEPSFETCVVNEKALRIMHAVHENLEDLVPKAEFLIAVKLVLSIPLMILAFLGTRWGFRMWRAAKRGYRPTFQQTGMMMQQGPMTAPLVQNGQMIPMQGVAGHQWINTGGAPGFQAAQDGTSAYSVQYPALTQGMAQQAAAAGDADGV